MEVINITVIQLICDSDNYMLKSFEIRFKLIFIIPEVHCLERTISKVIKNILFFIFRNQINPRPKITSCYMNTIQNFYIVHASNFYTVLSGKYSM